MAGHDRPTGVFSGAMPISTTLPSPHLLTLETLRNGVVIARASTRLSGRHLIEYRKLQVRVPHRIPFDQLRLVASGTANDGVVFMVLATVTVSAS